MNARLRAVSNENKTICTQLLDYIYIYIYKKFRNFHNCIACRIIVEWTKLK